MRGTGRVEGDVLPAPLFDVCLKQVSAKYHRVVRTVQDNPAEK